MLPLKQQGDNNQDKDKHTVSSQHTVKKKKKEKKDSSIPNRIQQQQARLDCHHL